MLEVDATGQGSVTPTYAGNSGGGFVVIGSGVVALLSLIMVVIFIFGARSVEGKVQELTNSSQELDQEITQANTLNGQVVETRAQQLVTSLKQYQKLVDGRIVWSKVLPALSSETLQGVSISGMSIDDKMNIKVDGGSSGGSSGSDSFTPYGMVARQVVAYRDAVYKDASSSTDTKTKSGAAISNKLFSTVVLNSVAQQTTTDKAGKTTTTATFSVTLSLNPNVVKLPPSALPTKAAQ